MTMSNPTLLDRLLSTALDGLAVVANSGPGRRVARRSSGVLTSSPQLWALATGYDFDGQVLAVTVSGPTGSLILSETGALSGDELTLLVTLTAGQAVTVQNSLADHLLDHTAGGAETKAFVFRYGTGWELWQPSTDATEVIRSSGPGRRVPRHLFGLDLTQLASFAFSGTATYSANNLQGEIAGTGAFGSVELRTTGAIAGDSFTVRVTLAQYASFALVAVVPLPHILDVDPVAAGSEVWLLEARFNGTAWIPWRRELLTTGI